MTHGITLTPRSPDRIFLRRLMIVLCYSLLVLLRDSLLLIMTVLDVRFPLSNREVAWTICWQNVRLFSDCFRFFEPNTFGERVYGFLLYGAGVCFSAALMEEDTAAYPRGWP